MHRMNHDSPFAALGNTRDTAEVEAQVGAIVRGFAPGHNLTRVGGAFDLLNRAFDGKLSEVVDRFADFKLITIQCDGADGSQKQGPDRPTRSLDDRKHNESPSLWKARTLARLIRFGNLQAFPQAVSVQYVGRIAYPQILWISLWIAFGCSP